MSQEPLRLWDHRSDWIRAGEYGYVQGGNRRSSKLCRGGLINQCVHYNRRKGKELMPAISFKNLQKLVLGSQAEGKYWYHRGLS